MKKHLNKINREYGWMGVKCIVLPLILLSSLLISPLQAQFQQGQMQYSQQFRLAEGLIRIAEPGQLADTVNVWGDVGVTGRYIVPRGTNLTDLISYARGPVRTGTGEADLDRARFRIELIVSRTEGESEARHAFTYRYEDSLPSEMRSFPLTNGDLVYLQVRRRPTYRDYITIVSPTLTLVLTAILLYDRARQ
jgi:hypothetical protein